MLSLEQSPLYEKESSSTLSFSPAFFDAKSHLRDLFVLPSRSAEAVSKNESNKRAARKGVCCTRDRLFGVPTPEK